MRTLTVFLFVCPLFAADLDSALEQFQLAKKDPKHYPQAAALFAKAAEAAPLSREQQAAWAYCRIRLAAEKWNSARGDAAVTKTVISETQAALDLVPEHAELQKFGGEVITAAGGTPKPAKKAESPPAAGWYSLESENFRVRFTGESKELAEILSKNAEKLRAEIFTKWSGPPPGAWSSRCEIVLHVNGEELGKATKQMPLATGHALVQLEAGKPSLRRIDLRSDDSTMTTDALPRELTHVVLADLFPTTPPPRWAAEGMAILAMSPEMIERYLTTARSQAKRNQLPALKDLVTSPKPLEGSGYPLECVAVVDALIRRGNERSFTIFLRDSQRYGLEKSLERQYSVTLAALESALLSELKN